MAAKIVHDRKRCIGCNACVQIAPANWIISTYDGKSNLVSGKEKKGLIIADIFAQDVEINKRAAQACPMNIIKVEGT